jgi:holo-ACP synthase
LVRSNEITLEQLLNAREQRVLKQQSMIAQFKHPLISFTVNIPGAIKNMPISRSIFREGCEAIKKLLNKDCYSPVFFEAYELDTGHEAYLVVNMDAIALKTKMLQLENTHPLGRLFDLDVIGMDGRPISREDLGYSKRQCLLCKQDAHICGRSKRHSIEELMSEIEIIVRSC